jgi:hypothetical protein
MGRQITDLDDVLGLCAEFEESRFRLETLQRYDVAYEQARYAAFLAGEAIDLTPGAWHESIRRHRALGKAVERVHVVIEPLSDYLKYEIATSYRRSLLAGEQIGIVEATPDRWPPDIPARDYWLFDDREVWVMEYDVDGRFLMAEHQTDPRDIRAAVAGKHAALGAATPLDEYLHTRHPTLRNVS